jgi:hypothetical protein
MKISTSQLKRIIKEELQAIVREWDEPEWHEKEYGSGEKGTWDPNRPKEGSWEGPKKTEETLEGIESFDALDAGTVIKGTRNGEIKTARKRSNGNWNIYLDLPEEVLANPEMRGVQENASSRYFTGMGRSYTWEVYHTP